MNPQDKFFVRNIVLSYLEACLINRGKQIKIQEDIAKSRTTVLNKIIEGGEGAEIQAVYAIQNFVHRLEHPQSKAFVRINMIVFSITRKNVILEVDKRAS